MNLNVNPSGRLLIVPVGIEISFKPISGVFSLLLIVPVGIEIRNTLVVYGTYGKLLIVPVGIEIRQL